MPAGADYERCDPWLSVKSCGVYDYGETDIALQNKHQFIELYNTTSAIVLILTGWKLIFNGRATRSCQLISIRSANRCRCGLGLSISVRVDAYTRHHC